jgi:hypothetical protein
LRRLPQRDSLVFIVSVVSIVYSQVTTQVRIKLKPDQPTIVYSRIPPALADPDVETWHPPDFLLIAITDIDQASATGILFSVDQNVR